MNELHMTASRAGVVATVTVTGDLDIATRPDLIDFLARTLRRSDQQIALNLAGLTFIDVGGLGMLAGFQDLVASQDAQLVLVNCPICVRRMLHITGFDNVFTQT